MFIIFSAGSFAKIPDLKHVRIDKVGKCQNTVYRYIK